MERSKRMKAGKLAEVLAGMPDYDVEFSFSELDGSDYGLAVRRFKSVGVGDIGHSDKVVILMGKEQG
jgi:hypothetical protein